MSRGFDGVGVASFGHLILPHPVTKLDRGSACCLTQLGNINMIGFIPATGIAGWL